MADTALLPRLDSHWVAAAVPDSRRSAARHMTDIRRSSITKINSFLSQKDGLHATDKTRQQQHQQQRLSSKDTIEVLKTFERTKSSREHLSQLTSGEREKVFSSRAPNNQPQRHPHRLTADTKDMKNNRTRLKKAKEFPTRPAQNNDKLCLNTYEKLKVLGVSLNSRDPPMVRKSKLKHASSKEIISPLLNSLENADKQLYYSKKNSFHSSIHLQKPGWDTNVEDLASSLRSQTSVEEDDKSLVKTLTIKEYLKKENARYQTNEQIIKKILFDNWLRNVQSVPCDDVIITPEIESSSYDSQDGVG